MRTKLVLNGLNPFRLKLLNRIQYLIYCDKNIEIYSIFTNQLQFLLITIQTQTSALQIRAGQRSIAASL